MVAVSVRGVSCLSFSPSLGSLGRGGRPWLVSEVPRSVAASSRPGGRWGGSPSRLSVGLVRCPGSVLDLLHVDRSLSLRRAGRATNPVSGLVVLHLGCSLSPRGFGRVSGPVPVSVLALVLLGCALSLRCVGRVGGPVSVRDFLHLGCSLPL